MITTDINVPNEWTEITLTESKMVVTSKGSVGVYIKFGVGSTSNGLLLKPDNSIIVDETVWAKGKYPLMTSSITVTQ